MIPNLSPALFFVEGPHKFIGVLTTELVSKHPMRGGRLWACKKALPSSWLGSSYSSLENNVSMSDLL